MNITLSVTAGASLLCALCAPLSTQQPIYSFDGQEPGDLFGFDVASAGDFDGDGLPDLIVGAREADPDGLSSAGKAFVYSGRDGSQLDKFFGTEVGGNFGVAVAGIGDVDGDGFDEAAVGSGRTDNSTLGILDVGSVRVFSGKTGAELYRVEGTQNLAFFGTALARAGDWDADGFPDFAVGAPLFDAPNGAALLVNAGRVSVHNGATGKLIVEFFGRSAGEQLGTKVSGGQDFDGDARPDLVAGSPFGPSGSLIGAGKLSVYSSSLLDIVREIDGIDNLGHLGTSVDFAGDANGDGLAEIVSGAYDAVDGAGRVYLFAGGTGAVLQSLTGFAPLDHFGTAVAGLGDVDRDGRDDFAAGAFQQDASQPGYVRVHSGATGALLYQTLSGPFAGDQFGGSLAGLGDVDGDGWVDLGIGARNSDPNGLSSGRAFVYDVLLHQPIGDFSSGPLLEVYGTSLGLGGQADLKLSQASAFSFAFLVVSPFYAPFPFEGGNVAPDPFTALVLPFLTNSQGQVFLPALPGGGGPLTLYTQFAIFDGVSGPSGWSFSNYLTVEFLP